MSNPARAAAYGMTRLRKFGAFPAGYLVTRPRDPYTGKALWDVTAPNGEWVGEFPLRRSALLMAQRHNQRAGFSKLRGSSKRRKKLHPTLAGQSSRTRLIAAASALKDAWKK